MRSIRLIRPIRPIPRAHASDHAFTLVEVVLAILIVGVGLTASMRALSVVLQSSEASRQALHGRQFAADLLVEIATLPYQDPGGTPAFGPEPDEDTATRAAFDDIDDYAGWSESPPQKKDGSPEPDSNGYTRTVIVAPVSPIDFATSAPPLTADAKLITITVARRGMSTVTLTTVRLRGANREDTN